MLKKKINGKEVICSPEEEAEILASWRPKTPAEIDADTDAATQARWKDDPQNDALMLVLFETYNEAREGNGKQPITKQQFWNGVKAKVRTEKFFDF